MSDLHTIFIILRLSHFWYPWPNFTLPLSGRYDED